MKTLLVGATCLAIGAGLGAFVTSRLQPPAPAPAKIERPADAAEAAPRPAAPAPVPSPKTEGPVVAAQAVAPAPRAAPSAGRPTSLVAQGAARPTEIARQVEKQYGPFLASLQAQGGDAATFRRMLEERQTIVDDIIAAARDQGINLMDREAYKPVGELIRQSIKDFNVEMKRTVGDQNYAAWVDAEKMKGEYNLSMELTRRLREASLDFPPGQQDSFVRALFDTKDQTGNKKVVSVMDQDGSPALMRVVPEAAIERMRSILTVEQQRKFLELYQDQQRGVMNIPPKL